MAETENSTLEARLRDAETRKEGSYDKRTDHLDEETGASLFINRLILEDSPYLLQHAHNPVNWYPWGDEAFAAARAENKPIFLSIGYSTCHWCHVMEVESFDNIEVAKVLNEHFISIKMDREQFPDIDEIYMTGVQLVSGQGGWPMSNFLLPDGRPFFGGTYYPAPSFMQILNQINSAWQDKREDLDKSAHSIYQAINRILSERKPTEVLQSSVVDNTLKALFQREDRSLGGLAGAPKFPQEPILLFLLDRVTRYDDGAALGFLERALEGMGRGGIYDQVAGGFHRYSVDEEWLVPHFEKMLYNQSQLGLVYSVAYQLTGHEFFARIARQTCDYVLRDMQLEEGGFYSATDADSEGEEGTFFVWDKSELEERLPSKQSQLAIELFGVTAHGNFEGRTILNLSRSLGQSAREYGPDFYADLDELLATLYRLREQREHPLRDDKLIVSWCARMATSLIQASQLVPGENASAWLHAAEAAVQRMLDNNLQESGELKRIYLNGVVSIAGQLEDYSNLIQALIALYDVTDKNEYLVQAFSLTACVIKDFWDANDAVLLLGPSKQTGPKLVRSSNAADGATLSPVATMLDCLLSLQQRQARVPAEFSNLPIQAVFTKALTGLAAVINDNPISQCSLLRLASRSEEGTRDPLQYAANGVLKIAASKQVDRQLEPESGDISARVTLVIDILEPWHVTAPHATAGSFESLIVALSEGAGWETVAINYPEPTGTLQSGDAEVGIYSGVVTIELHASRLAQGGAAENRLSINAHIQLCDDEKCLLPEKLTLVV